MLELIFWIVFWIILGLALLCILAYLSLPWIFKVFVSPLFNASYKYDSDDFDDDLRDKPITEQVDQPEIVINDKNGSYSISFGKSREFSQGIAKVHYNGELYSNGDINDKHAKQLKLEEMKTNPIEDELGNGEQATMYYTMENTDNAIQLSIKTYHNSNFIIFSLTVPNGLQHSSTGEYEDLILGFPSFYNNSPNKTVFTYRHSIFCPPSREIDTTSAPVILYDDDLNCAIISPLDEFLNAAISEEKDGRINCGIQGEIKELPEGYTQSFIIYFGQGINKPLEELGNIILNYHDSSKKGQYADLVCSHLGYWTDNGAYYYYKTERGLNYEDTLVTVKEYFDEKDIPIKYFNFDSWWYLKHTNKVFTTIFRPIVRLMGGGLYGNTLRWETDPEKFSTDLQTFYQERFKLPITAHNRRWDARSPYLDEYDFITYKNHACPLNIKFWDWLMGHAKNSGIMVYEQDWMKNQIDSMPQLREDITTVKKWLNSMAVAAKNHDINIFYCMQTPAILLYSIKHPNITITRCSGDYNHRWPLTYRYVHSTQTNILIHAFGLNSHPDVFRSRSMEESFMRPFGEKYPVFKCLYQILNAGVVAPGDKKENVNWNLLKKTCRGDGLLYKPDKPLTANDLMFKKHKKYYICDTHIKRENLYWRFVLVSNIWPRRVKETSITAEELGYTQEKYVLYDYFEDEMRIISREQKIPLGKLDKYGYKYLIFVPLFSNNMAVIGSTNKFVPCSKKQVTNINTEDKSLELKIEELEGAETPILLFSETEPAMVRLKDQGELERGKGKNKWNYDKKTNRLSISLHFEKSSTKTLKITLT